MAQPAAVLLVRSGDSAEGDAALTWLRSLPEVDPIPTDIDALGAQLGGDDTIVWFHQTEPPDPGRQLLAALDAHTRAGGGLLATLAAVVLPHRLGWEDVPVNEITSGEWRDEPEDLAFAGSFSVLPRVRGLQSCRGHPLFDGLGSGCYTWDPVEGEPFVRFAYADEVWPDQGRVIAVQRSYIAMSERRRLAWEYAPGDGWAVCIGGFVQFATQRSMHRPHLERLMRNALHRVRPGSSQARLHGCVWTPAAIAVEESAGAPLPPPLPEGLEEVFETDDDLRLRREAGEESWTLAGTRAFVVGRERTGLEEVWFHPARAVSRWQLSAGDGDALQAEGYMIRPGIVERRLPVGDTVIVERTTVAPEEPGVLIELRCPEVGAVPVELAWSLETDLRPMWPYPAAAAGRLCYQIDHGAVGVVSEAGEWLGLRVQPPLALSVEEASDGDRSRIRISARLSLRGAVHILLLGAGRTERPPLLADPVAWRDRRREARAAQRAGGPRVPDGDVELAEAVEWAKWRLSTYRVRVPGLGCSLVAGYERSRRGRFFDGRPGFGWFFGRDAVWTALACLALGEQRTAREVLEFLGRHQDITGKILHECTTSGVVHYDAADSTPLYLLLAARYLSASGDEATLRREWPRIVKAYEFCLSTDSDGDGLVENTDVGHGWVEFGPLGGNHVSLYLASVWVAAVEALEFAARRLGEHELAEGLAYQAGAARASLELAFFDPVEGRYATGIRSDGSRNMTESVLTAVGLLSGAVRRERCDGWLERVASDAFTSPWGVRIVARDHPDYEPGGYHTGAVWPLFTGWVALAEARAGRLEAARRHWEQVARLYHEHSLGAFPEVLHGDEPRRIGVTPDQAWSAAMAVWPLQELSAAGPRPLGRGS